MIHDGQIGFDHHSVKYETFKDLWSIIDIYGGPGFIGLYQDIQGFNSVNQNENEDSSTKLFSTSLFHSCGEFEIWKVEYVPNLGPEQNSSIAGPISLFPGCETGKNSTVSWMHRESI